MRGEAGCDGGDERADTIESFGFVAEIGNEAEGFDGAGKLLHKKVVIVAELDEDGGELIAFTRVVFRRLSQSRKEHEMLGADVDGEACPKKIEPVISGDRIGLVASKLIEQRGQESIQLPMISFENVAG